MKISEKDLDLLIGKIKSNNMECLEYQEEEFSITLKNGGAQVISTDTLLNTNAANNSNSNTVEVKEESSKTITNNNDEYKIINSPLIGNFYLTKDPESSDLVKVGDSIKIGDTLCVIEAMKMIQEVKSEVNGKIVEILAEKSSFVDLDTPIFKIIEE